MTVETKNERRMLSMRHLGRVLAGGLLMAATVAVPVTPAGAATGTIQFSTATTAVDEDAGTVDITVTRSDTTDEVTVDYLVAGTNSDGNGGRDFTIPTGNAAGTLTFAPGVSSVDISVNVNDDLRGEGGTETFTFTLQSPENLSVPGDAFTIGGQNTHSLEITDDGDAGSIVFSTNASSVAEGDSGTTTRSVSVTRTGGSEGAVTGQVASTGGSATAGVDYVAVSSGLSWPDGVSTARTVDVVVNGDNALEVDEQIDLTITAAGGGASIGGNDSHTVTITDDDAAGVVSFAATSDSVGEADGTLSVTLNRTGGSDGSVSVTYATVNGTAVAGSDFVAETDTIVFSQGETTKQFDIAIIDDLENDDAEQFVISISGDVTGDTTATISIVDDDDALEAVFDSFTTPEDTTLTTPVSVLANDNGPSGATLTVQSFGAPTSGSITSSNLTAGTFVYEPAANFEGDVFISYVVTDGTNTDSGVIRVVVTDDNAAPVAADAVVPLASRIDPTEIDVLANDSDQDGDPLSIVPETLTSSGGNEVVCTTSVCTFTPEVGFVGADEFVYTAQDSSNVTDSATVTVYVGTPRDCDVTVTAGVPFVGTSASEVICGTAGDDVIDGGGGDDYILGLGGDDVLRGGDGSDLLAGGPGSDLLEPGPGDSDESVGGAGVDTVSYTGSAPGATATATGSDSVVVGATSITIDTANDADGGADDADSHESVETVLVDLLGGNDIVTVSPSTVVSFDLRGGDGLDRLKYDTTGIDGETDSGTVITATGQQPVQHTSFEIREVGVFMRIGTPGVDDWFFTSQPLVEGLIIDQAESGDRLTVQFGALTGPFTVNDSGVFGEDTVVALGTGSADDFEIRARQVRTDDEQVTFGGIEVLRVEGRGGDDAFTIDVTAAFRQQSFAVDLTVDGGDGHDVLRLTSDEACSVDAAGNVVIGSVGLFRIQLVETVEFTCAGESGITSLVDGYWLVGADGTVYAIGSVPHLGNRENPDAPVAGMDSLIDKRGYWVAQADGNVAAFGTAVDHGDLPDIGVDPAFPIVDMSALVDGSGYYLLGSDGGVFAFKAPFYGSTGDLRLDQPVVAMSTSPNGGYWFVASDGGIFAYGPGAAFHGSVPEYVAFEDLQAPIVGMAATTSGNGYWLVAADGGVFAFGDAVFYGSVPGALPPGTPLAAEIVGIVATASGNGYWIVGADGGVFAFGDAQFQGAVVVPANDVVSLTG